MMDQYVNYAHWADGPYGPRKPALGHTPMDWHPSPPFEASSYLMEWGASDRTPEVMKHPADPSLPVLSTFGALDQPRGPLQNPFVPATGDLGIAGAPMSSFLQKKQSSDSSSSTTDFLLIGAAVALYYMVTK